MTATKTDPRSEGFARLRESFPPEQIGVLPKPRSKDAPKGRCDVCNGWHGLPAVHLDYVGHAALTQRLLEVDPEWTWEHQAMTRARMVPPRSPAAHGALALQAAEPPESAPLRAVQARAGEPGAAALSPEGAAFHLGAARQ